MSGAGYSGTPLWKKLGVKPGATLLTIGAPKGFSVPDLPEGAHMVNVAHKDEGGQAETILAFFGELATLSDAIASLGERIFPDRALWIAWPRRAGGHDSDIREQSIRDVALPLGLVDVKVAALDEDWSGLRLVWRKERRG